LNKCDSKTTYHQSQIKLEYNQAMQYQYILVIKPVKCTIFSDNLANVATNLVYI